MKTPFIALCLIAPLFIGACHDDEGTGTGREPDEYLGCATDEQWSRFVDVPDVVSDPDAPVLTTPAAGTTFLPATPARFDWKIASNIAGSTNGDVPSTCEQWNPGLVPAHLPPISGTVYDLQLLVGGQALHRTITTMQAWQASDEVWAQLEGKTVEVRLRRITVLQNDRKEGPYAATKTPTFAVAAQ